MNEEKKSKAEGDSWKDICKDALERIIGFLFFLVIVFLAGIVMFGDRHKATENDLKATAKAQADISNALFIAYHDFGRIEVRYDRSVYAYIPKKNYMSVPYPDRDESIVIPG
jgi:hypothetical protein